MIGLDSIINSLIGSIIGTTFDSRSVRNTLTNQFVRNHYGHHGGNLLPPLGQNLVEIFRLRDVAREAVQKKSVESLYCVKRSLNHAFHNRIRHELSCFNQGFGLLSKLRSRSNLCTEKFACGKMLEIVLLCYCRRVSAFACTRRTEKNIILHV